MAEVSPRRVPRLSMAVVGALVAAVLVLGLVQTLQEEKAHRPIAAGSEAPALDGVARDGGAFHLASLRGRRVLLTFFATWCVPCREELPMLLAVAKENPGVSLVAASLDDGRDREAALDAFFKEVGGAPTVFFPDQESLLRWKVEQIPVLYVIDSSGRIVAAHAAGTPVTKEKVEAELGR